MYTDDRVMILNNYTNGQSSSSMLIIDPVLTSDSGWYTCTAFNDAGHSSQRIYVDVHCKIDVYPYAICEYFGNFEIPLSFTLLVKPNLKPYPTSAPVRVMLGSSATLQTLLVDANPMDVTVQWLGPSGDVVPDSQYSIFNTSTGTVYTVNLITLSSSSGGVYTCEVENSIGISIVNFTLLVIGQLTCTVVYTSITRS